MTKDVSFTTTKSVFDILCEINYTYFLHAINIQHLYMWWAYMKLGNRFIFIYFFLFDTFHLFVHMSRCWAPLPELVTCRCSNSLLIYWSIVSHYLFLFLSISLYIWAGWANFLGGWPLWVTSNRGRGLIPSWEHAVHCLLPQIYKNLSLP